MILEDVIQITAIGKDKMNDRLHVGDNDMNVVKNNIGYRYSVRNKIWIKIIQLERCTLVGGS